jgi:hypothetical protein
MLQSFHEASSRFSALENCNSSRKELPKAIKRFNITMIRDVNLGMDPCYVSSEYIHMTLRQKHRNITCSETMTSPLDRLCHSMVSGVHPLQFTDLFHPLELANLIERFELLEKVGNQALIKRNHDRDLCMAECYQMSILGHTTVYW